MIVGGADGSLLAFAEVSPLLAAFLGGTAHYARPRYRHASLARYSASGHWLGLEAAVHGLLPEHLLSTVYEPA